MSLNEGVLSATIDRMYDFKESEKKKNSKFGGEGWLEEAVKYKPKPRNPLMMFQEGVGHDDDRLFSPDAELLIKSPTDIIKDSFEFAMVSGLNIKWTKITKLNRKSLRGISCIGVGTIYQITYREIFLNGKSDLTIGFVGVKGRNLYQCALDGFKLSCTEEDKESFIIACSLAEDSNRANSFMINFDKGGNKFRIPADKDEIRNLLLDRKSPNTATGRLKPILHMVSRHKRGKLTVDEHKRGLTELKFCGYDVLIKDHEKIANEV